MEKSGLESIVGRIKADRGLTDKSPPMSGTMDGGEDAGDGQTAAAEEIISAIKSGNAGALSSALSSFVSMCGDYEEEEPGE